jgi:hypothetical protein
LKLLRLKIIEYKTKDTKIGKCLVLKIDKFYNKGKRGYQGAVKPKHYICFSNPKLILEIIKMKIKIKYTSGRNSLLLKDFIRFFNERKIKIITKK